MTDGRIVKHDVLVALQSHTGKRNGITAALLACELQINMRAVRQMITELREDGIAVCGHPADGYYIAANADELEETCNFLRQRALHSLTLESRLRHIPLPDLLGQMHLKT